MLTKNALLFSQSKPSNFLKCIAMFLVTSPIVINVPTRGLLAVETMHAIVRVAGKFEYQKKYDVNVCKQVSSLCHQLLLMCQPEVYWLLKQCMLLFSGWKI